MKTSIIVISSILAGGLSATASTVAVGNILESQSGSLGFTSFSTTYATSFTTGPGLATPLEAVILSLQRNPGQSNSTTVSLGIYSDAGGQPGSSLVSLSSPQIPASATSPQNFTFTGNLQLAPSTTYWVVAEGQENSTFWTQTNQDTQSGLTGWEIGDDHYLKVGNGPWSNNGSEAMRFNVVIPETSSALLAGLGSLALLRRRR